MKKILILTSIWGHESIAKGIRDALKDSGHDVHLEVIRIDPSSEKSYQTIYRFLPWLFKSIYRFAEHEFFVKIVNKYFEASYFKLVKDLITENKPDVVISTYFAFNSSIEKLKSKYKYQYLNFIPDPWSFTRIQVSKKGLNLVFDKYARLKIDRYIHAKNAKETGWFTEDKFNTNLDKSEARKTLGIDPKTLTVCVTTGSEGTYDILKIINSFVNTKRKVQILFMCGKNKQLYDLAKSFAKILGERGKVKVLPHKYTSRMNVFVRASDLVMGKAGPNTIFESVACGVPFFAVTHISGQEDGNLELIRKYNIGYTEENPIRIAGILKSIMKNPKLLEKFEKPTQNLADYNQHSHQKLLELLKD